MIASKFENNVMMTRQPWISGHGCISELVRVLYCKHCRDSMHDSIIKQFLYQRQKTRINLLKSDSIVPRGLIGSSMDSLQRQCYKNTLVECRRNVQEIL